MFLAYLIDHTGIGYNTDVTGGLTSLLHLPELSVNDQNYDIYDDVMTVGQAAQFSLDTDSDEEFVGFE